MGKNKNSKYVDMFRVVAVICLIGGLVCVLLQSQVSDLIEQENSELASMKEEYEQDLNKEIISDINEVQESIERQNSAQDIESTKVDEDADSDETVEESSESDFVVDSDAVYQKFVVYNLQSSVNVRSTPSSKNDSNILGKIKKGTEGYVVEDTNKGWLYVVTEDIEGYIAKNYADISEVGADELEDYYKEYLSKKASDSQ